jgi:hypothetical protein
MAEQTPQQILDTADPNRVADAMRRVALGTALRFMGAPVERSLATTPALTIATNDVNFPEPAVAILGMTATVGGSNTSVVFIPPSSAVAATASGGAAPAVHHAKLKVNSDGLITGVTFSGAPTVPFVEYLRAGTELANKAGVALS